MSRTFPLEPDLDPLTVEQQTAKNKGPEVDPEATIIRLQKKLDAVEEVRDALKWLRPREGTVVFETLRKLTGILKE